MQRRVNQLLTDLNTFVLIFLAGAGVLAIFAVIGFTLWVIFKPGVAEQARSEDDIPIEASIEAPPAESDSGGYPEPTGQIVYTCFNGSWDNLCVINPDGSGQRQLTDTEATDWYAAFSEDGATISFSSRRSGGFELYLMDASGLNVTLLSGGLDDIYAPEISPDGTRIVFVTTINGKQDIYTMNRDGSGITQITTHSADDFDPTWSPDGTQIAFTSNRTGTSELHIINVDGSGERQVTSGSDQQDGGRVDWSPDGSTLAFYAGERGDKDLFTVPAECSLCGQDRITRLTDGGNNKAPAYSPDGAWITFASNIEGDNEIFIMRVDGTDWRQVTFNALADWQPRWGP